MSAIFGVLNFDGAPVASRDIERMSSVLAHRGERARIWTDGVVGLGHRLMRVTEEDRFDAQPLDDAEAGVTLVADIRLDNRPELAQALGFGNASLREMPDSAMLMAAYKKWGEDCARHLLGDFVFAIWDARRRRLLLGRDHLGQRSVCFHRGERSVVFASEIKALWAHPQVPRVLKDAAIAKRLLRDMSPRAGQTNFEGIEGVTGATVIGIEADGAARSISYWKPGADPAHEGHGEDYYIAAYRRVLDEAVACRLRRTIHPAGLLLSGGYDSAAVAALAGATVTAQGRKLVAVCSAMAEAYRGTIRHARHWAELCRRDMPHLDLHYVTREGKDLLSGLEKSFGQYEGPLVDHYARRDIYDVLIKAGVRVVLDGYGGDQTLNPRGYPVLARFLAGGRLSRFAREFQAHRRATGSSFWRTLRNEVFAPLLPRGARRAWRFAKQGFAPDWVDKPIQNDFARQAIADGTVQRDKLSSEMRFGLDFRAMMMHQFARHMGAVGWAPAEFHGLEATHPFFDKRVVELALAIPHDLFVKNGRYRYLACRALADLYPPEFQTRWRMNDSQVPDFQRMVKSIEPQLLLELARLEQSDGLRRYVDFETVRRLLAARGPDDHNSGWEEETLLAVSAIVTARYIEWFRGSNR